MEGLNLTKVIEQVSKDKGIDARLIVEALELAMLTAAKKKLGHEKEIEAKYNPDRGEVEVFEFKTVVKEVLHENEISLEQAKELDPESEYDDVLGVKLNSAELGRISAQTAKQVIIQKVRDAERDITFTEYESRKGQIVTGIVRRFEKRDIVVDIGKTEAVLPECEQISKERYRVSDRVQALIIDVQRITKGPQIILSRADNQFLVKLFEAEVPEIYEGTIKVYGAAREPGDRAKIAVASKDSDVDPIGACVGVKGSRVQNIVQELKGERIDIVPYSADFVKYVCNALGSSIEVVKVILDEKIEAMDIVVPDDMLSLAIGKRGQNVRLASMLTGWSIDIRSEAQIKELADTMKAVLVKLNAFDEDIISLMIKHGVVKFADFLSMENIELSNILGIKEERVVLMKEQVVTYIEEEKIRLEKLKETYSDNSTIEGKSLDEIEAEEVMEIKEEEGKEEEKIEEEKEEVVEEENKDEEKEMVEKAEKSDNNKENN
ncbi:MAG: transcription termination factor NusA [Pseudomonadota bacterium]